MITIKKITLILCKATLITFLLTSCSSQEEIITNKEDMKNLLCLELSLTSPSKIVKISLDDGSKEIVREIANGMPDGIWVDEKNQRFTGQ